MHGADRVHGAWPTAPPRGLPAPVSRGCPGPLTATASPPPPLSPRKLAEQTEQEGWPSDKQASGAPAALRAARQGPAPRARGRGGQKQLAQLSRSSSTRSPHLPVQPRAPRQLCLLIKQPRNMEFTDVLSSPSSRNTQNGRAENGRGSRGHLTRWRHRDLEAARARAQAGDRQQRSQWPGLGRRGACAGVCRCRGRPLTRPRAHTDHSLWKGHQAARVQKGGHHRPPDSLWGVGGGAGIIPPGAEPGGRRPRSGWGSKGPPWLGPPSCLHCRRTV